MNQILQRLEKEVLVRNGAIGNMLQRKGADLGGCFGQWIVSHPVIYQELLKEYFEAGCTICGGGTSGLNRHRLEKHGLKDKVQELNRKVVRLAREVMSPDGFTAAVIGPTGKLLEPFGELSLESANEVFGEQAAALAEGGADIIFVDTMHDLDEAVAALRAVKKVTGLPVSVALAFDLTKAGLKTIMGVSPEAAAARLELEGADIIGANCGSLTLQQMSSVIRSMRRHSRKPLFVRPNAGPPKLVGTETVYLVSPEHFAEWAPRWIEAGAKVISGCCGTTPLHLKKMVHSIRGMRAPQTTSL